MPAPARDLSFYLSQAQQNSPWPATPKTRFRPPASKPSGCAPSTPAPRSR
ncbi:hypothetical protein ACFQT0_28045 [Hymenobacter humi]|uniref:Uncharacterized protein n=1 Tax=Hymenobacter humi TaxID=1411620 RepID=A0ABW2UCP9_9BACT